MWFMNYIIQRLNDASGFFYGVYLEVISWVYPFWLAAFPFYNLSVLFSNLAWDFYDFNTWVDYVEGRVASLLTFDNIYSYFSSYFDAAVNAWNWVDQTFGDINTFMSSWWSTTQYTVLAWVDEAKSYAAALVNNLSTTVNTLLSAWDDFKGRIPTIDEVIYWWGDWTGELLSVVNSWWSGTLLQVQSLIDSAFTLREPFWDGWQDWRDKVIEFFTDPEDYLAKRIESMLERFW